jgi:type IV pilus assembly protein PilM
MLKLLKPNVHSVLGLDISSTSVKAIELSGKDDNRCIEGFGSELLPPNVVEGHTIKDIDAVAHSIKQLVSRSHLKSKFVTLAVPDSAVISKILQVNDDLNETEIEEFIIMEADKYIPYPIEEISIDFEILGRSLKSSTMLDVLIVASRSENVSSRVEAVTKAGLQVKIVDVESFAIERAIQLLAKDLPAQGEDKVIAVIDIRDEFANLYVLHRMKIIYTRQDEFGGKQLIEEIAQQYGVTNAEALQMKAQDKLPEDYVEKVLNPFIEVLLLHVKRSLQFFFSTSHHGFVDHILLAGVVARLPDLAQLIERSTKIPTSIANPTSHLRLSSRVNTTRIFNEAPSLLIACGLALRNVE